MSEKKRFILAEDSNGLYSIFDTEDKEDEPLIYGARFGTEKIVDLLNTQQATINNQEQKIKILQQEISDAQAILEMLTEKLKGWNDE